MRRSSGQLAHRRQAFGLQKLQVDLLVFPQGMGQLIGADLKVVEEAQAVK
jgi:hypothetical protein